jgi:uncharacterized protein (DUF952 family)
MNNNKLKIFLLLSTLLINFKYTGANSINSTCSLNLDPNKCYKILEYKYYNPDNKQNPVTILPIDIESGFIHMSFGSQVENTLNKFFKEIDKVIILEIDPNLLKQNGSQVIVEQNNNIGNYYPHIYGKQEINNNAIANIIYATKDGNGKWVKDLK